MASITLKFEGYSDDTFSEVAFNSISHDNCANGKPIVFEVTSEEDEMKEGLFVVGIYNCPALPRGLPGSWLIGIQPLYDEGGLPDWNARFTDGDCDYSPCLELDVPKNYQIRLFE
jgi:hypothetical protein